MWHDSFTIVLCVLHSFFDMQVCIYIRTQWRDLIFVNTVTPGGDNGRAPKFSHMSHVLYEWVNSNTNESCPRLHIYIHIYTHAVAGFMFVNTVTPGGDNGRAPTFSHMSHVSYEWVISNMNESCPRLHISTIYTYTHAVAVFLVCECSDNWWRQRKRT